MPNFWRLVGRTKSRVTSNKRRQLRVREAFQKLWVGGVLGALFFSLARKLPTDIERTALSHIDLGLTLSVYLGYLQILWLVLYFMLSSMDNDIPNAYREREDVRFDVIQSLGAFTAAYFLGFVIPLEPPNRYGLCGHRAAFATTALIAGLAFYWFRSRSQADGINGLRLWASFFAIIGLAASFLMHLNRSEYFTLGSMVAIQLLLWLLLGLYLRIRYNEVPPTQGAATESSRSSAESADTAARAAAEVAAHAVAAANAAKRAVEETKSAADALKSAAEAMQSSAD